MYIRYTINEIVGDYLRISKYKNIFAKVYTPNWSLMIQMVKKLLETFLKKNCRRQIKKNLEYEK